MPEHFPRRLDGAGSVHRAGALALPFAAPTASWAAIGVGQIALYLLILVIGSFYVRRAIGNRVWRAIHFAAFVAFSLATAHGAVAGTDGGELLYWIAAGTILFLTIHRVIRARFTRPLARIVATTGVER